MIFHRNCDQAPAILFVSFGCFLSVLFSNHFWSFVCFSVGMQGQWGWEVVVYVLCVSHWPGAILFASFHFFSFLFISFHFVCFISNLSLVVQLCKYTLNESTMTKIRFYSPPVQPIQPSFSTISIVIFTLPWWRHRDDVTIDPCRLDVALTLILPDSSVDPSALARRLTTWSRLCVYFFPTGFIQWRLSLSGSFTYRQLRCRRLNRLVAL